MPTAVVCDDAPGFRILLSALLAEAGVPVAAVGECWADAERLAPGADVIVLDLWMPEYEPDALLRIRASAASAMLVVVTALELEVASPQVEPMGIDLLLSKMTPPAELAARIAERAAARAA